MNNYQLNILIVYLSFIVLAAILNFITNRLKNQKEIGSVQQKSAPYLLINLLFISAIWSPQKWHTLPILLGIVGLLCTRELLQALSVSKFALIFFSLACGIFIAISDFLELVVYINYWLASLLIFSAIITLVISQKAVGKYIVGTFGAFVYFPLCFISYIWLWYMDNTGSYAIFLYMVIAINDIFSQVTGEMIGKHVFVPKISESKTVEGSFGGLFFSAIIGTLLGYSSGWGINIGFFFGIGIGVAGQIGDLMESKWKRVLGIKDFSNLLGANGGVLDRFDSLMFAAPLFYLALQIF